MTKLKHVSISLLDCDQGWPFVLDATIFPLFIMIFASQPAPQNHNKQPEKSSHLAQMASPVDNVDFEGQIELNYKK